MAADVGGNVCCLVLSVDHSWDQHTTPEAFLQQWSLPRYMKLSYNSY